MFDRILHFTFYIFHTLHGSAFSLLIIIFATFSGDIDIKMGDSIVRAILKKVLFCTLLIFFISNVVRNIFLSSSSSGIRK